MAPEQVEQKRSDERYDIFSFGCILYEAITRERPFQANSDVEVLYKILHEPPPSLEKLSATIPSELRRLVERCLEKNPNERCQSMRDVALDLRLIVDRFSADGLVLPETGPAFRRRPLARLVGMATVAALILAGIGALVKVGRHAPSDRRAVMQALV